MGLCISVLDRRAAVTFRTLYSISNESNSTYLAFSYVLHCECELRALFYPFHFEVTSEIPNSQTLVNIWKEEEIYIFVFINRNTEQHNRQQNNEMKTNN